MKTVWTIAPAIVLAGIASAAPVFFSESFSGNTLDPAWTTSGNGHIGLSGTGYYELTDAFGGGKTEIYLATVADPADSFDASITLQLDSNDPNTKTDFHWRMQGRDGTVSIKLNSWGNLSLHHNVVGGASGNIVGDTNIGYTDGSTLTLNLEYRDTADIINVFYSINGEANQAFYSGGGFSGTSFGDFVTLRSTAELNKFNNDPTDTANLRIDQWDLIVPEPATIGLLGLGSIFVLIVRKLRMG